LSKLTLTLENPRNYALNYSYKFTEHQNIHFFNFNPLFPNLGLGPNFTHWVLGLSFQRITISNIANDYFKGVMN